MAEAAALALAAAVNDRLNVNNTTFLSDCQNVVQFINAADQSTPLEWRILPFTQLFLNLTTNRRSGLYKINRSLNTTADSLAKQAHNITQSSQPSYEPVCLHSAHVNQCPTLDALLSVSLHSVRIIAAKCC